MTLGSGEGWPGPVIYDNAGDVVWSGTAQLDSTDVNDFRLSNVGGQLVPTLYDRNRRLGLIFDDRYRIRQILEVVKKGVGEGVNAHEFKFVENGTKVLVIMDRRQRATERDKQAIGFDGDACWVEYNKLVELDVKTGDVTFQFDPRGRIGLEESSVYHAGRNITNYCRAGWDFMHANSIDKSDDGHYLFNARHTNTVYKISKDDGSIIWRLGGKHSDFDMGNVHFSRQHDIRFRGQNATHTIVSLMDNALGEDEAPPTHDFSRGLLIALNTVNMTASLIAHYDHPDRLLAQRRGNMQILDDGHVFMGWSEHAYLSEHAADGTVLLKARLVPDRIGSYRAYKFPFVGRPLTRPDVVASTSLLENRTVVHVSWNGDTQVRSWRLYTTARDGTEAEAVWQIDRRGFETRLEWSGLTDYVRVAGLDKHGESVGWSDVVKTIDHPSLLPPPRAQQMSPDDSFSQGAWPGPPRYLDNQAILGLRG